MSELKPCPFCGGKAAIYELKCGWYVDCSDDDNCSHNPSQQNGIHMKQDAIDNWNTRAPQSEWVSVDAELPKDGQSVNFEVDSDGSKNQHLHGKVLGGTYDKVNDCFCTPGVAFYATRWTPSPELPQ